MFGRYRLCGRLAAGGMAEVWAAQAMLIATGMAVTTESLRQTMPPTEHIDPN